MGLPRALRSSATHVFLVYYFELSRENAGKQKKELATYPCRIEPRIPRNSGVNSLLSGLFRTYGNARSVRALWALQEFLEKPRNLRENFPRFLGFSLCAKKPRASHFSGLPWLFLDSGVSLKAWKAKRKFSTLSRLVLRCKKAWRIWLEWLLALLGSFLIPEFPGKPGNA